MIRKRFFDPRLFLEGLRQLRLIGLAGMLALVLEAIFIPLDRMGYYAGNPPALSGFDAHPFLILTFVLLAPLMTLTLFQFLNKRPSSDLYHSLPDTRLCLFVSFFAAIFAWIAAIAVVSTLLELLLFSLVANASVSLTSMLLYFGSCLAGTLLVMAGIAVAMCVTGTFFTNLVVSALILFAPRLIILLVTEELASLLPVLVSGQISPFFDTSWNVVTNLVFYPFFGHTSGLFSSFAGIIYTLALGLIYTILAAWLFCRRKSEIAGKAAPNRWLQALYRLTLAMLICLFPTLELASRILSRDHTYSDPMVFVLLYVIAIAVYLLYELFTTRKWRNLPRSLPALGLLVLLNGLLVGGIAAGYFTILNSSLDPEKVQSVQLVDRTTNEYYSGRTSNVQHTSPTLIKRLTDTLDRHLADIRATGDVNERQGDYHYETTRQQQVIFHLDGRTITRRLFLKEEDFRLIGQELEKNEAYRQAYLQIPADAELSVNYGFDRGMEKELLGVLREEVASLDFTDWYSSLQMNQEYYGKYDVIIGADPSPRRTITTVSLRGYHQLGQYYSDIPLNNLLPRTANRYMEMVNQLSDWRFETGTALVDRLQQKSWQPGDRLTIQAYWQERDQFLAQTWDLDGDLLRLLAGPVAELGAQLAALDVSRPDIGGNLYRLALVDDSGAEQQIFLPMPGGAPPDFLLEFGGDLPTVTTNPSYPAAVTSVSAA